MALNISLPALNGAFDVGLAAGVEARLEDIQFLGIAKNGYVVGRAAVPGNKNAVPPIVGSPAVTPEAGTFLTADDTVRNACLKLAIDHPNLPPRQLQVLMAGAYVCIKANLIRTREKPGATILGLANDIEPDGDWKIMAPVDPTLLTDPIRANINAALTLQAINDAATLIAATKVNWFKENHHTGQGAMSGYTKKVATKIFGAAEAAQMVNVIHQIGHWASTRQVLSFLGIAGIAATGDVLVVDADAKLTAAADVKLRIQSNPSGTARHFIARALAKRLVASTVVVFAPRINELIDIETRCKTVLANPASFHQGALYLTGTASSFNDMAAEPILGMLGTFGEAYLSNSTIMKSPHVMNGKFKGYDYYSVDFETALNTYMIAMAKANESVKLPVGIGANLAHYEAAVLAYQVTANQVVIDAFNNAAAGSTGQGPSGSGKGKKP